MFQKMLYTIKNYALAIVWASIIAFLSLTASQNLPKLDWTFVTPDKVGHFTVYALLNLLALLGYYKHNKKMTNLVLVYFTIGVIFYGFVMEWAQYLLTPDRCFEYPDMLANAIGAILGCLVMLLYRKQKNIN